MATPNATGKNSTVQLFVAGNPVGTLVVQSWECGPDVTEITDDVCGEDRSQLDTETNFFLLTLKCFTKDLTILDKLLDNQAKLDAGTTQDIQFGLVLKPKDGSKGGYVGKEACFGAWKIGAGGRTERIMQDVPVRMRYWDKAAL